MLKIRGFFPYILIIFLNSFIDLGHKVLIQNTLYHTLSANQFSFMSSMMNALILLPFLLLFTPSGFIADKFKKVRVLRLTAAAAIPLTIIATWCYYHGEFIFAFVITLLLAIQSTLNSPAKYGYIRELFNTSLLAKANAVVQTVAILAILAGTLVFSVLFDHFIQHMGIKLNYNQSDILKAFAPAGYLLILSAILETGLTYLLPEKSAADAASTYRVKGYFRGQYLKQYVTEITRSPLIFFCVIGLGIFWGINQVILASYGAYLKAFAHNPSALFVQTALVVGGLGILIGATYAGRVSRGFIEKGFIPTAAIGLCICLFILCHITHRPTILLLFFIYGIFGGMLVVPLNALIQYSAKRQNLGKVMAANNFVQTIFMLSFLLVNMLFISSEGNVRYFLYCMILIAIIATIYAVYKLPQALIRYILFFAFSRSYRLSVNGLDNLPTSGAVLLLGNHISLLDWAILQVASPRPIRFVMEKMHYDKWYFRWMLEKMGIIPIVADNKPAAYNAAQHALNNGEVVAMFPEGQLCQNGQLGQFHDDFVPIIAKTEATIIPFYLLGLWGTSTTFATQHYKRLSKLRTRPVSVTFGPAIDGLISAARVKQKVTQLSINAWKIYVASLGTIPELWIDRVKQIPNSTALIDSMGLNLTNIQLLSTVLYMGFQWRKLLRKQNRVGILLPAGAAGIIANLTILFRGKTVVNLNYTSSQETLLNAIAEADIKTIITAKAFIKKLEQKGYSLTKVLQNVDTMYLEDYRKPTRKLVIFAFMVFVRLTPLLLLDWLLVRKHNTTRTAAILFSSGSEAKPKGIELSHQNIIGNAKQISSIFNIEEHDKMLSVLPLFHAFGLTATTIMPLLEGTPVVCHPDPTDVANVAKLIEKYQVTIMCATSTFLGMYCRNRKISSAMLQSLRLVIAGAEKLSTQVRKDFKEKFGLEIYEGYGATEVAPVASANLPDVAASEIWQGQVTQKLGTVGLPVPGTAFKIVDPETMQTLPVNTEGMILIGGTQVMKGYLNDPSRTRQALIPADNYTWYITGDKGKLDEDGFLTIVDRYSRFAKVGGEMVSLGLVEQKIEKILNDPDAEVMAIAVPDAKKGEKIILLYHGTLDPKMVRTQMLAEPGNNLLLPADYVHVDAIPKLGSGKKDYNSGKLLLGEM